jgi:hypothetical protein
MSCVAMVIAAMGLTSPAFADDDPPARVARMNYAQGSVSLQPGGEGDWVEAVPNRPLTTGDNLWTDKNSRAEFHAGSTAIRMGAETSMTFLELDDDTMQFRLAQGSMLVRVRHMDDNDRVEIDTPNLAFNVQRNGEYRVDVDTDGHATIIDVYQGRGEVVGGSSTYTVVAGQQATFSGDEQLSYDINRIPRADDFTKWAMDRDVREDRANSANYVSRDMTGYEDLDQYGHWRYVAEYGPVWVPAGVPSGWAPYRDGHWVWVAPWGWTWVDDEPWGFAPFHYGRWAVVGGAWGWVPGPVVVRPVYAPALVAFVGGTPGFHFSVSIGGGGVGWFPLAPGEVYVPGYHVTRAYVDRVNVTNTVVNVTKITNVYNNYTVVNNTNVTRINYVNQRAGGVTVVSHDTFVNARPVARNVVEVPRREIEEAPVGHMNTAAPVRTSVMGAGRPTRVEPPAAVMNRRVMADRAPSQPPVPLEKRHDPLEARPVSAPRTQPNQPAMRPEWSTPRPESPRSVAVRPEGPTARPETPRPVAERPEGSSPEPRAVNGRPAPIAGENENQVRPQQGWSHPQARPAPAVQPKSERQAKDDESKFNNWQRQREASSQPRQASQPSQFKNVSQPKPAPQQSHAQPARSDQSHSDQSRSDQSRSDQKKK